MKILNYLTEQESKLWEALNDAVITLGANHEDTIRAHVRWSTTKQHREQIERMIEDDENSIIILQAEKDAREEMDAMISAFGREDHGTKRSIHQWYIIDELIDKLNIQRK